MSSGAISKTDFKFPGQTAIYHGKVRDVYTIKNKYMVAVATDRISAFDVVLPEPIPYKGQVLNQIAAYFLKASSKVAPNWLVSAPDPNVSIGYKCLPYKVEMIVRGCLVGSAWRSYMTGKRAISGAPVPDGMKEYDQFPKPIITPTTKAEAGHDEDITLKEIVKQGLISKSELNKLCDYSLKLFAKGQQMAKKQGLYLADTKYEFGKLGGKIYLIDEVHTPDSSRYFYLDSYNAYLKDRTKPLPCHLSKEFVREWLMANNFSGEPGQKMPKLTVKFIKEVSDRYIELYQEITGQKFKKPPTGSDPKKRIETNVIKALKDL